MDAAICISNHWFSIERRAQQTRLISPQFYLLLFVPNGDLVTQLSSYFMRTASLHTPRYEQAAQHSILFCVMQHPYRWLVSACHMDWRRLRDIENQMTKYTCNNKNGRHDNEIIKLIIDVVRASVRSIGRIGICWHSLERREASITVRHKDGYWFDGN